MRLKRHGAYLLFAIVTVLVMVVLRLLITGPQDLEDLARFESGMGVAIGPETAFFASALNGDGATFTIIALDPLGRSIGQQFFEPSYRYARFGYPLLARALALGRSDLVLMGLSVVGLVAVGVTAFAASVLAETRGRWAWLLVCNPALIIGALWDTAEPLALSLLTVAFLTGAVIPGLLVAFVRPTYLLALANRPRLFLMGILLAVVGKAVWSLRFGESFLSGLFNVGLPFVGIFEASSWVGVLVIGAGVVTFAVGLTRRDWAWILSGLFVVCFSAVVLDSPINALRAAGVLPVLWAFGPRFQTGPEEGWLLARAA